MNARELTAALQGRWCRLYGMAPCPAHEDRNPSLSIRDSGGRVLLHCHAGCEQQAVMDALRRRGLWGNVQNSSSSASLPEPDYQARQNEQIEASRQALAIWRDARRVEPDDLASRYLRTRGIDIPIPPSLRFSPSVKYSPSGLWLPAMVAGVQAPDRKLVAVHRTYLNDPGRKAQVSTPKMALGPCRGGAVRLGPAGKELGVAEGIETGLSAVQLFDIPVWVALGSHMARVKIPFTVEAVTIFADNGTQGREAAEKAADAFTGQGKRVTLRYPPEVDADWNDTLQRAGCVRRKVANGYV